MKANRITEKLHIEVEYLPNGYIERYDEWELHISVNDDLRGNHYLTPSACYLKDLTLNEILQEIKQAVQEELEAQKNG
ncbi:MAG: hypothetical protein NC131_00985 [Roseburia sp.]|nr:hypothetical protein [Roseburia sp.]